MVDKKIERFIESLGFKKVEISYKQEIGERDFNESNKYSPETIGNLTTIYFDKLTEEKERED